MRRLAVLILTLALLAPLTLAAQETTAIASVVDAFHSAASRADEEAYFALLAPNAVFIGTDATERWDKEAFRAFAHPYFSKGKGWTFTPRNRHIDLSRDGRVAWFDELLDSATYGECRGSGVLEKLDGGWRITQYHLTIPMPNDLAKDLVARIRDAKKGTEKPK
ncbi:MAG TPA: nuclear transport factor 2 family protein [Thermoanaerobaculia bacterium]|jgi:ketosteroid isomerase-like protein|nr:nuclear transport factor 2 family protein [Thermoanaerobaculia bacterium]